MVDGGVEEGEGVQNSSNTTHPDNRHRRRMSANLALRH